MTDITVNAALGVTLVLIVVAWRKLYLRRKARIREREYFRRLVRPTND